MKACNKYDSLVVTNMTYSQFNRWLKKQQIKAKFKSFIRKIKYFLKS